MAIEFRKPTKNIVTGNTFLFYGDSNTGKTTTVTTFPKSIFVDTEGRIRHFEKQNKLKNTILVGESSSFSELEELYNDLYPGSDLFDKMQTLIIDSKTNLYYNQQISNLTVQEKKAKKSKKEIDEKTVSQRGWGNIKLHTKQVQASSADLSNNGKFVVETALEVAITKDIGNNESIIIGYKPDVHRTEYKQYNTVVRLFTEEDGEEVKYFAKIEKDGTKVFKPGQIIQGGVSYKDWEAYFDLKNNDDKTVVTTKYSKDTQKDIDSLEGEDNKIQEAKQNLNSVIKKHDIETAKKVLSDLKIKSSKEINTLEIAEKVIKACKPLLKA